MNNWDYHSLRMDFSSMYYGDRHPSDIDMVYLGKENFLIIAEIKNECGSLKDGQRRLLETLVDGWKHNGLCLYVTHDKYVQNGDTLVDVPDCFINRIYYKGTGKWLIPKRPTKVKEILERFGGVS